MLQSAIRLIYPSECLLCRTATDSDFALCGQCWRDTPFISGLVCDCCGTPLVGSEAEAEAVVCDDCMVIERPWSKGRSALRYQDNGRDIVLGLKHGDRSDLARPASRWMAQAGAPLLTPKTLIVPVPLHWTRLLSRRYNQSAVLATALGKEVCRPLCVDAIVRTRKTASLDGQSRQERFETLADTMQPHPKRGMLMRGRDVLIVDDVMTTGATLSACAVAAQSAGAASINMLTLARAAKDT